MFLSTLPVANEVIPYYTGTGHFFLTSFLWAGYYIPAYFFMCAFLLLQKQFRKRVIAGLSLSILPFLTIALMLRLFFRGTGSPGTDFFLSSFGRVGSLLLLILLLSLEIYGIFLVLKGKKEKQEKNRKKDQRVFKMRLIETPPADFTDTEAEEPAEQEALEPEEPLEEFPEEPLEELPEELPKSEPEPVITSQPPRRVDPAEPVRKKQPVRGGEVPGAG